MRLTDLIIRYLLSANQTCIGYFICRYVSLVGIINFRCYRVAVSKPPNCIFPMSARKRLQETDKCACNNVNTSVTSDHGVGHLISGQSVSADRLGAIPISRDLIRAPVKLHGVQSRRKFSIRVRNQISVVHATSAFSNRQRQWNNLIERQPENMMPMTE